MSMVTPQKIIVLDRDGVINQDSDAYIKHPDEWHPEAGSIEAIVRLKKAGWTVAIATNQSGIKRGYYDRLTLSQMHLKLQSLLMAAGGEQARIDWLNFSPYVAEDNSVCRKPLPGMLQAIENRFGLSLSGFPMIGDTLHDVSVAKLKGMRPLFVKTGKGAGILAKQDAKTLAILKDVLVYDNLLAAVEDLLA